MRRSYLLAALTAAFFSACTSENHKDSADSLKTTTDTTVSAVIPEESDSQECYAFVKNRDTVSMKIHAKGEEYSGDLSYNLFEKDRNKGTFGGEMKGDTLITEYTFDSEGMRSVREAVFLKKDGKLYEGFGEVLEKEGKTVFKDRSKLNFGGAIVLEKTACN
jgi:hypothetical protein